MTELFRTTVGSRLYGLHTEESDHDRRGVKVTRLGDLLLDPQTGKNTQRVDEEGDLTLYELNHFVRLLMQGNPTMLETWYSLSLTDESLAGRFAPLLDSGQALKSLKGYLAGATALYEKKPTEKKAWKNMAGGLTYVWLYYKLFEDGLDFSLFEDLARGCRAGDADALTQTHLNLLVFLSAMEDLAQKKADRSYAMQLLENMYAEHL